jgi:hypothetical protein
VASHKETLMCRKQKVCNHSGRTRGSYLIPLLKETQNGCAAFHVVRAPIVTFQKDKALLNQCRAQKCEPSWGLPELAVGSRISREKFDTAKRFVDTALAIGVNCGRYVSIGQLSLVGVLEQNFRLGLLPWEDYSNRFRISLADISENSIAGTAVE